jgi:hypothetical protein
LTKGAFVVVAFGYRGRVGVVPVGIEHRRNVTGSAVPRYVGAARTRSLLGCHVPRLLGRLKSLLRFFVTLFVRVHQRVH